MIYNKILGCHSRLVDAVKKNSRLETGFSMLEAVVVVGVLLALAIGGALAYGPIVQNAKLAKLKSAASEVYTAATVYQIDGDPKTKPQDAIDTWNASNTSIKVGFFDTKVIAVPAMMASAGEFAPAEGEDFCIQATDTEKPEIQAKSGNCPEPTATSTTPTPVETPAAIPTDPHQPFEVLKNGDFSEGLKYWEKVGTGTPVVTDGIAVIAPGDTNVTGGVFQKISIPAKGVTHVRFDYQLGASSWQYANSTVKVSAFTTAGVLIKDLYSQTVDNSAIPKTTSVVDLTEFAGQDIKIAFQLTNANFGLDRKAQFDNISVQNTTATPSAPRDLKLAVVDTDATITWTPPQYGDASVTSYSVIPYRNGVELTAIASSGLPPKTSAVFKGLTNGGDYVFKVTAINANGESEQSAPSEMYSRPAKVWENGDFSSGLTGWQNIGTGNLATVASGQAVIMPGASTLGGLSQVVTIPDNGATYAKFTYRLAASSWGYAAATFSVNAYRPDGTLIKTVKKFDFTNVAASGTGEVADLTEFAGQDIKVAFQILNNTYGSDRPLYLDDTMIETTTTAPSAPTGVTVAVNAADATIRWNPPVSGSLSTTKYTVTPYRDGSALPVIETTTTPAPTSIIFKGLNSGSSYRFTVKATNRFGSSEESAASDTYVVPVKNWVNGDFTSGLTGWAKIGLGKDPIVDSSKQAVIYSGTNVDGGLAQTVTVPRQGITTVNYAYSIQYTSWSGSASYFTVRVYDTSGNFIKELKKVNFTGSAVAKTTATTDLTEFAGQDIKVAFQVNHNSAAVGRLFYLDDTSIQTK